MLLRAGAPDLLGLDCRLQALLTRAAPARHELYAYMLRLASRRGFLYTASGPQTLNGPFDYEGAPQRPFEVVTAEEDADATDPEVFSGPATTPSLEKPIEARTSNSEVPRHRQRGAGHPRLRPASPAAIRSAFLIEADQTLAAAACPQMTHCGHSVEYAVQQVGTENQEFPYRLKSGLTARY